MHVAFVSCYAFAKPGHVLQLALPTLRKNKETRLDTIEMKGLREIMRVSWTARTNEWVLSKAGLNRVS